MKRWTIRFAIWLLLGAAISAVLAWVGAAKTQSFTAGAPRPAAAGDLPPVLAEFWPPAVEALDLKADSWPMLSGGLLVKCKDPGQAAGDSETDPGAGAPREVDFIREAHGWPMRCMYHDFVFVLGGFAAEEEQEFSRRTNAADGAVRPGRIPLWIVRLGVTPRLPTAVFPLGLLADTVFFGAIIGGLWSAPGLLRGRTRCSRRRRGLCVKCGYDLAGNTAAVCPECGWGRA
jgi:hypothetical protein